MPSYVLNIDRTVECRMKLGISKREAAKRIGISQPAYIRYESGDRTPSMQVIEKIASVFNTSADYLLGATDSPDVMLYEIRKKDEPQLFELIEITKEKSTEQINRIIEYAKLQ